VRGGRGHVDLPRARELGFGLLGMTVATSWPDVGGSLSRWHFRSLGLASTAVGSRMVIAEWLVDRIERWSASSDGQMFVVRTSADLERCLAPNSSVGILLGVQGGHVLEGDVRNIGRLRQLGVRMFAPAHVMDNDVVGSGTGKRGAGLSGFGREVVAELEAQQLIVDLAHMSPVGIEDVIPLLTRPFVVSHGALRDPLTSARPGRLRRYNASTRNVPISLAQSVGARNGLFGVVMATQLLGSPTLENASRMIRRTLAATGDANVALGSDMDGALKMLIDVEGVPALVDALLADGVTPEVVRGFLGGNAARFLRAALPAT
jgi:membrane dipeptidase